MIVLRKKSKAAFLKESLIKHYGKVIMFDNDDPTALIVGDNEFKELPLTKYGSLVEAILEMEQKLSDAIKSRDDLAIKLQQAATKLKAIKITEQKREKLLAPKVVNTIKYKVTRFAIRVTSASGTEETLQAIDHAVHQMTDFVRNFCAVSDSRNMYDLEEFEIDI
jgi:hypothetical protein